MSTVPALSALSPLSPLRSALLLAGCVGLFTAMPASAELFFSKYIEGTGNQKALEIYNNTGATVDLAAAGYAVQMYFNGSSSAGLTINLTGSVAPGDVFVLAQASALADVLAQADQTNGSGWFNGDDAITLTKAGVVLDSIGQIGFDPGSEWGTGLVSTADNTLHRKAGIDHGDTNPDDVFDPTVEWDGYPTNDVVGLGSYDGGTSVDEAPTVSSITPAGDLDRGSNLTISFSEPVTVADGWYDLDCTASGHKSVTVTASGTQFILDPDTDFSGGESCTLTVHAALVVDQDGTPTAMAEDYSSSFNVVDLCAQPYTAAYVIQGNGADAAVTGPVTTQGVVVGDFEGASPNLRGFFIQDPTGDGDPETSDAVFVFNGNNDSVSLGDVVRVTGNASDYQGQTQVSASQVLTCGHGSVAPTDVVLPFPNVDFPERYEGMLVRFPQTLFVTEHYQLGRFGQVVMSSGGPLMQPTEVLLPGAEAQALAEQNALNRVIVDDALNNQNPDPIVFGRLGAPLSAANTLRAGDAATGMVGVLTYTWAGNAASGNAWRLRPTNALGGGIPNFQPLNPRPATAPSVGGSLKVASFNVLNYFVTLDRPSGDPADNQCGPYNDMECRGADSAEELQRQHDKLMTALIKLDADIVGLVELENTTGVNPLEAIVDGLNQRTASGTYAYVDTGVLGGDAIRVGLIYKPAKVDPLGDFQVLDATVDPRFDTSRNRPALAQSFEDVDNGARFTVVVNHLKSKGDSGLAEVCTDSDPANDSADCDTGDGQGYWNQTRTEAAHALADWIASDPTGIDDPDYLLLGDFNSYRMEDPIRTLEASGLVNMAPHFLGDAAYSYVFDGQWGSLDHAFATSSLVSQITGAAEYHINADEPSVLDYNTDFKSDGQIVSLYAPDEFRTSDHDPVVVGINPDGLAPRVHLVATPRILWPANHKMVTVKVYAAVRDDLDPNPTISLVSVTSNEAGSGWHRSGGHGHNEGALGNDIEIIDDFTVRLRAERSGRGDGRVYTLVYEARDHAGNISQASVEVVVPHSMGH